MVVHVLQDYAKIYQSNRLRYAHQHVLSGVTTIMSTHFPLGCFGPQGKKDFTR